MATYQSAKQAGFQGAYTDWINAGRPEGGQQSQYGGDFVLRYKPRENTGRTELVELNVDPMNIASMLTSGDGFGAAANRLSRIDSLLPADISKNVRPIEVSGQGDINIRNLDDVDWDRFEDPELAKLLIGNYTSFASQVRGDVTRLSSANVTGSIPYEERVRMAKALVPNIKKLAQENTQQISQQVNEFQRSDTSQDGGLTQVDPEFGVDPNTNQPLTFSQAYAKARQSSPGLSVDEFRQDTDTFLELAGIPTRKGDLSRPGTGSVSDQNLTGIPYPTWAEQQRAQGQPSSYQDWLSTERSGERTVGSVDVVRPTEPTTGTTDQVDTTQNALAVLEGSPFYQNLPEDQKALLRMTVQSWDATKEVNMDNVLSEFEKIKSETIDPHFAEQVQVFSDDVKTNLANLAMSRGQELEAERFGAGENIRQARSGLEKSGMTFTGKGIEQLGAQSAFAQPGDQNAAYIGTVDGQLKSFPTEEAAELAGANTIRRNEQFNTYGRAGVAGYVNGELRTFASKENAEANNATGITELQSPTTATPTQTPFGGMFYEGTVNQANRLMSTASSQRYQENLRRLGRQTENVLGAAGAQGLIPGFSPAGVSTGSLQAQQQQQLATTLSQLSGQQGQLNQYKAPVDFNSFNQTFN
jgi:hypothetical protein